MIRETLPIQIDDAKQSDPSNSKTNVPPPPPPVLQLIPWMTQHTTSKLQGSVENCLIFRCLWPVYERTRRKDGGFCWVSDRSQKIYAMVD